METDIGQVPCLDCGAVLEASTYVGPGEACPAVNDATVCFCCGAWLMFASIHPVTFRKPTPEEYLALKKNANAQLAQQWVKSYYTERTA